MENPWRYAMNNKCRVVTLYVAVAGLMAGACAGIGLGAGIGVALRLVAVAVIFPPPAGTADMLEALWLGILIGAPAGLLFAQVRHRLPPSEWSGPLYGLGVMLMAAPFLMMNLSRQGNSLTTPAQLVVAAGSFA